MSLDYDIRNTPIFAEHGAPTSEQDGILTAIVFTLMAVDLNGLPDEDAVDEFLIRSRILSKLSLLPSTRLLTRDDLGPFTGITTNVRGLPRKKWLDSIVRIHLERPAVRAVLA